jgi:hypothetical protein
VNQHHTDIQGAQYCDVQEDVGEVLVVYDDPIHRDDEGLFPELWDVLKYPAQVS